MNTSDQNVFTLDTAFKRRWEFKKLKNEFTEEHKYKHYYVPGMEEYTWENVVRAINDYIINVKNPLVSEDKQIGVFFVKEDLLVKPGDTSNSTKKKEKFAYKMLEYLWNDVAKYNDRPKWFNNAETLDEAIDQYLKQKEVFSKELMNKLEEYKNKINKELEENSND